MSMSRKISDFIHLEQGVGNGSRLVRVGTVAVAGVFVSTLAATVALADSHYHHLNDYVDNYYTLIDCDDIYGNICGKDWHYNTYEVHTNVYCVNDTCQTST